MSQEQYKFDVFISYSRHDFEEVNDFVNLLKREIPELNVWFDLKGIESGDEFDEKIVGAIDNSARVLFMFSDNATNSKWAKKEVMYAHNTEKRVIPIMLAGTKLKGWFLFTFGNIDSIDVNDAKQVNKLVDNIREWCGVKEKPKTPKTAFAVSSGNIKRINKIIADILGVDSRELSRNTTFADLGADSLDYVELIMEFEKEFNIAIPDHIAAEIRNLGDVYDLLG